MFSALACLDCSMSVLLSVLDAFSLLPAHNFYYLNQSGCTEEPTIIDTQTFKEVLVRFTTEKYFEIKLKSTQNI